MEVRAHTAQRVSAFPKTRNQLYGRPRCGRVCSVWAFAMMTVGSMRLVQVLDTVFAQRDLADWRTLLDAAAEYDWCYGLYTLRTTRHVWLRRPMTLLHNRVTTRGPHLLFHRRLLCVCSTQCLRQCPAARTWHLDCSRMLHTLHTPPALRQQALQRCPIRPS